MPELIPKTSVSEAKELIREAVVDALNKKRLYFVGKESQIPNVAKEVSSMLEEYLKQGNTRYLGYAVVIIPFEEPEENENVPHGILEVVWSRVDLKKAIENLGILSGKEEYETISKDLAYRFFVGAKIVDVKYFPKTKTKVEHVGGLSPSSSAFWKVMRYIEKDYFGNYEGTATDLLLISGRLGRQGRGVTKIDKTVAVNFYRLMSDFNSFVSKIRDLFGDNYSNRKIRSLFERVIIDEVNELIPAILALSKQSRAKVYIITRYKIFKVSIKYLEDYKKILKGFSTWSSSFFKNKFLPALLVSNRAQEVRDPDDIL